MQMEWMILMTKVKVHWADGKPYPDGPDGWVLDCTAQYPDDTMDVVGVPFSSEEDAQWVLNYLTKSGSTEPLEFEV
ncbi:MAG: hypothetical protein COA78_20420 [Blastopirellula sp.]|nr:MAG: hypothetical protein COA78_20420 [Blastopirellula sp.]